MHLVRIGSHAINIDRVAEIWDQGETEEHPLGKILVYFGDHCLSLEGDEATAMRRFVREALRPSGLRPGPAKHTADLSGLEPRPS